MSEWDSWVGREETRHDLLTPSLVSRFRATIDSKDTCAVAPQGIHFCLCTPDTATSELDTDGHPRRGGMLPPVPLPRRMWASSDVEFLAPILIGAAITRRSRVGAITEKVGGSGHLVFVSVDHETDADGLLAIRERQVLVYRAATSALPAPRSADVDFQGSEWTWSRSLIPSATLLQRYSALTFNSHRIHFDVPYAHLVEHYRGLVVHGPLIATLLLDLAASHLGSNRVSRIAFRGLSPAFAAEPLHLGVRAESKKLICAAIGNDGRLVMSADAQISPE